MSSEQEIEDDKTSVQGESLLLPLLQELLDKKGANAAPLNRSCSSHSSEGSNTAAADSGTESGEDLRLLAAGLYESDKRQGIEPLGPGLLTEVQNALAKLAISLQLEANPDIEMDPLRRNSLLELVKRLQSNLVVPTRPPMDHKLGSNRRFLKNKNRQHRHTVGVSSEELAAARKLMEEVVLKDNVDDINKDITLPTETESSEPQYTLQKQHSDGNVVPSYTPLHVPNSVPKPFMFNNKPPIDIHSYKLVKNITEGNYEPDHQTHENKKDVFRKSFSFENSHENTNISSNQKSLSSYFSVDSIHKNAQPDYENHQYQTLKQEPETPENVSTYNKVTDSLTHDIPPQIHYVTNIQTIEKILPPDELMNKYDTESRYETTTDDSYIPDSHITSSILNIDTLENTRGNRYNNRKLKMKRANTIDIPKPANYIVHDEDDDSVLDNPEQASKRNYLALRGPIRMENTPKSVVPSFEPKTENDKKFMAFIQKHNKNSNINSLWHNKPVETKVSAVPEHNWSRKFGNIKTIFESDHRRSSSPMMNFSSAKRFWQSADNNHNSHLPTETKEIKREGRVPQNIFEQKQKQGKLPWAAEQNKVVTGSLRVDTTSQIKQVQNKQVLQGKNYQFVPQPLPVNKFSHAPMSAFKPPPKKTLPPLNIQKVENKQNPGEPSTPLYLYTPKQLNLQEQPTEDPKQVASPPWVANQSEHRVLNLLASKFENTPLKETVQPVMKHKVHIPEGLQKPVQGQNKGSVKLDNSHEKQRLFTNDPHHKPAINKVRRLSGEYDSKTMKQKIDDLPDKQAANRRRKLSADYSNVKSTKNIVQLKQNSPDTPTPRPSKPVRQNSREGKESQSKSKTAGEKPRKNSIEQQVAKPSKKLGYSASYNDKGIPKDNQEFKYEPPLKTHVLSHPKPMYNDNPRHKIEIPNNPQVNHNMTEVRHIPENPQYKNKSEDDQFTPLTVYNNTNLSNEYSHIPARQQIAPEGQYYNVLVNSKMSNDENVYLDSRCTPEISHINNMHNSGQNYPSYTPEPQVYSIQYNNSHEAMDDSQVFHKIYGRSQYEPQQMYDNAHVIDHPNPMPDYEHRQMYDGKPYEPVGDYEKHQTYMSPKSPAPINYEIPKQYYGESRNYTGSTQPQMYVTPQPEVVHKIYGQQNYEPRVHFNDEPQRIENQYDSSVHGSLERISTPAMHEKYEIPTVNLPETRPVYEKPKHLPVSPVYDNTPQEKRHNNHPQLLKIFDYSSPEQSPVPLAKPDVEPATPPLTEYKAVSKVMVGPVCQQAVTVSQNTPKRREEHDTAATHLQNILQKRSSSKDSDNSSGRLSVSPISPARDMEDGGNRGSVSPRPVVSHSKQSSGDDTIPISKPQYPKPEILHHKPELQYPKQPEVQYTKPAEKQYSQPPEAHYAKSIDKQYPKPPEVQYHKPPEIHINNKTITSESFEINKDGETVLSTKLQIPVESRAMQYINSVNKVEDKRLKQLSPTYGLSKSDSWHQLALDQHVNTKPSPRASPRASPQARQALQKAKSSHSLALPKQFEAGISRDEVEQKKKTVQAYFGSNPPLVKINSSSNIHHEEKRSNKYSKTKQNTLSRSKTMPDVAYSDMFDDIDDDVDAEFENIFKASVFK